MSYDISTCTVPNAVSEQVKSLLSISIPLVHSELKLDYSGDNICYMLENMIDYYCEDDRYIDDLVQLEYYLTTLTRENVTDIPNALEVYAGVQTLKSIILELGTVDKSALIHCEDAVLILFKYLRSISTDLDGESTMLLWSTIREKYAVLLSSLKTCGYHVKDLPLLIVGGKYNQSTGNLISWNGTAAVIRDESGKDMNVSTKNRVVLLYNLYKCKPKSNDDTVKSTVTMLTNEERLEYESQGYYTSGSNSQYIAYGPIAYLRKSGINLKGRKVLIKDGCHDGKTATICGFNGTAVIVNLYENGQKRRISIGRNRVVAVLRSAH